MPQWEIQPPGDRSARGSEVPGSAGTGFPSFPGFVRVLPEDDQIHLFSRPFSRASECRDQREGRPFGIAGNGTLVSSAVNFFQLSKLLNQESAWAHPSRAAGFTRRSRNLQPLHYGTGFSAGNHYSELQGDAHQKDRVLRRAGLSGTKAPTGDFLPSE
jgi:hypothetical protein